MATLNTKTLPQLVQGMAAAVQARASGLIDFSIGSISRALAEAFAGVVLWLQGLLLALLAASRLSTSSGSDVDSFIADFAAAPTAQDEDLIKRLLAVAASGRATFSRLTTGVQVIVPVGASISTQDGSQSYAVIADSTNTAYSATLGGYPIAAGATSVSASVQAKVAGAGGNALAGAINTITGAIPGVDAVTNPLDFTNGIDAEGDAAYKIRFRQLIIGLRRGTPASIEGAVENLQRNVTAKVVEKLNHDGTTHNGYFYVLVDDGTGFPSSDLLTAAGAAIDAYHAAGIPFGVFAPDVVSINVTGTLVTASGADHAAAVAAAEAALAAYLNALPIKATVYWSRIWQILQDASADIVEVTGLSVNSGTSDIVMTTNQVAKAGTLAIS